MPFKVVSGKMKLDTLIDEVFRNPSGKLWIQIFRYLVSGSLAFLADAGFLTLLTELFGEGLLLLWTAISFCVGLTLTYLLSILWVFDNRTLSSRTAELGVFATIGLVGLGFTEALMWLFAVRIGIHYLLSKVITTVLVFIWNFSAKKTILFREK